MGRGAAETEEVREILLHTKGTVIGKVNFESRSL